MQNNNIQESAKATEGVMHGAAIIDAKGKETPITEDMVQQALNNILKSCKE